MLCGVFVTEEGRSVGGVVMGVRTRVDGWRAERAVDV